MGNGKSLRELIFSDDVASACAYFLNKNTKDQNYLILELVLIIPLRIMQE